MQIPLTMLVFTVMVAQPALAVAQAQDLKEPISPTSPEVRRATTADERASPVRPAPRVQMKKAWRRSVGLLGITSALALLPTVAMGQMGPGMGMRRPNEAGTAQQQEAAPKRDEARRGEPARAQMTEPMGHRATPFYLESTFLVIVGAAVAAAGLVAYRLVRVRWRRRQVPAGFVTEAVLVVDLVQSTHLATHYGDGLAMKARTIVKDRTRAIAEGWRLVFAESTGDGYFMTFGSVADAVRTAVELLADLRARPPDLAPAPAPEVRAGITYGEILLDGRGIRHGAVINKAFRIEGVTREAFVQLEEGAEGAEFPDRNRILLDEEAAEEGRSGGFLSASVGFCRLKGFSGLHRVYQVRP